MSAHVRRLLAVVALVAVAVIATVYLVTAQQNNAEATLPDVPIDGPANDLKGAGGPCRRGWRRTFAPDRVATHGEAAVLMVRLSGSEDAAQVVDGSPWWTNWVKGAIDAGYMEAEANGDAPLTRGDLASTSSVCGIGQVALPPITLPVDLWPQSWPALESRKDPWAD